MIDKPLISVIINCYNGEKYLRKSIDSVIVQTYDNWELVIWDNQSTDSTREIVSSYKNPKIKYFYAQEHTTLGEARNLALSKAIGEYVGFLDVDDKWLPSFLSVYFDVIKDNPKAVLIYSNYFCQEKERKWLAYQNEQSGIISGWSFVNKYNIAISSALFKSSIIKSQGIYFNTNFSLIEDYDFFIKLSLFGNIVYISKPLMVYLYHENNLSNSTKWVTEFNMLLSLIDCGEGVYINLSRYKKHILKRAQYVEANYYISSEQKSKAWSIIVKNILLNPSFFVLVIKIIVGPNMMRRLHILKKKV